MLPHGLLAGTIRQPGNPLNKVIPDPCVKILIADDDRVSRRLLEARLLKDGHEVIVAEEGNQAWSALQQDLSIPLAILDWNMPGLTGPEICGRARQLKTDQPTYLILLTSRDTRQ